MTVSNTQYYPNLPFEDYLALPGISYSSLTGFSGEPTEGMKLGTRVHQFINEPEMFDWEDAGRVRAIAGTLRSYLGDSYEHLQKEVSFTADFEHNGLVMHYKGRADMIRPGRLLVDLKILSGPLDAAIKRFGYNRQMSGYCLATDTPMAIILAYNKLSHHTETKIIKPDSQFWEYQIARNGEPQKKIA